MPSTVANPTRFLQAITGLKFKVLELHGFAPGPSGTTLTPTVQGTLQRAIVPEQGRIRSLRLHVEDAGVTAAAQINQVSLVKLPAGSTTASTLLTVTVASLTAADGSEKAAYLEGDSAIVDPGDVLSIEFVDAGSAASGPMTASVVVDKEFPAGI